MLVKLPAECRSLCRGTDAQRRNKRASAVSDSGDNYYRGSQPSFTLEGTRIYLQQRFAFVPSSQEISHVRSQNKTYSCFAYEVLEERKRKTKTDTKRISGGVRRTSVNRRLEQQKPSTKVVYKKRTKSKNRSVATRQPLVMCTMNLPGKHVPQEKATQMFPSTEEAKQMLRRLLASTNHECTRMMAESVSADDARQRQDNRTELLDKPDYLEDTYDYLFHRHVQTLNGVIQRQEQQEADEARGIYQQKHSTQVIQLCCGDSRDCDETSISIDSTELSSRHNSSTVSQNPAVCSATGNSSQDSDKNDVLARQTSCNENKNKEVKGRCKNGELTGMSVDNQIESCHDTQKRTNSDGSVNINIVTNKINALELQVVRVPQKPVITFNHVSETNECSSSFNESESPNLKLTKSTSVSSTLRSSSSSPLLEVPASFEDLTSEMMRPPIN
ncbi:uncharacterized protein LOC111868215 [Cryptotermes secundus]|nr:uncharacterized protein LOC111868215 [Cryptotermes secundus]XP_023714432.1 uncharacterized protein LOC111868215 [Cryptotermes secundus]